MSVPGLNPGGVQFRNVGFNVSMILGSRGALSS
jgi:hypothetical protein